MSLERENNFIYTCQLSLKKERALVLEKSTSKGEGCMGLAT